MINLATKTMLLAAALALAACNTTSGDQPGPAAAAAPAGTTASVAAPDKDNKPAQPKSRAEAASECWMKAEKLDAAQRGIDSRLSFVEKCIAGKMKGAEQAAPKT